MTRMSTYDATTLAANTGRRLRTAIAAAVAVTGIR
jgi:hypothetical protein